MNNPQVDHPQTEQVSPAFEILLESVESDVTRLNELGGEAFKKQKYQAAKELADQAQRFATFRAKLLALSSEWEKLRLSVAPCMAPPKRDIHTGSHGKLQRGMRTTEARFYRPILEASAELGGSGKMNSTLDIVHKKIAGTLKPVDHEALASGPKSGPRWRNTAQWARNTLKERGHLKSDSPHGVWEIAEAGRQWLEKAMSRGDFLTL
jgi:hypothetical protein